jgi:hypothetical protein
MQPGMTMVGDAMIDPNMPYMFPTGVNPAAAAAAAAGTAGTTGTTVPTGSVGGGTSPSSGGGTTTRTVVSAPMLVRVAGSLDRFWTNTAPYLRAGDALVAEASNDTLAWADRAKTDAPLVTYIVTFSATANLEQALSSGLPATLNVVGIKGGENVTEALATKVHATGRRLFASVNLPSSSLAVVGANADIVELITSGATATELAEQTKTAVATLGTKARIYVRIPAGLASSSSAAKTATTINASVPAAGIALPASETLKMSDYRDR